MERSGRLSKNKCWEFNVKRACEVYLENKEIPKFKLSAEIREKVDHAGFFAELDLLGFYLEFSIIVSYDIIYDLEYPIGYKTTICDISKYPVGGYFWDFWGFWGFLGIFVKNG